jgi:hypothetical protein
MAEELLNPKLIPLYNAIAKVVADLEKDITERKISPRNFRIEIKPAQVHDTSLCWQKAQDSKEYADKMNAAATPDDFWALLQLDMTTLREGDSDWMSWRFVSTIPAGKRPWSP